MHSCRAYACMETSREGLPESRVVEKVMDAREMLRTQLK